MGKMSAFKSGGTAPKSEEKEKEKKQSGKVKFTGKGKFSRSAPYLTAEEKKKLYANKKCYFCKEYGHLSLDCPKRKSKDKGKDAEKPKNKDADKWEKKKPSARLVPDMTGEIKIGESSKLFRAWGKVRDQTALVFSTQELR